MGIPIDSFGDEGGIVGRGPNLVAPVIFYCRSDVEILEYVQFPCRSVFWKDEGENSNTPGGRASKVQL